MSHTYDPVTPPVALTVAGSDSGGGAGIQADLKTMTAHGVFGTSVVTATTAQNTRGVHDVHALPADHVAAQYDAVLEDFPVTAVKTGMLATAEVVETVADRLADATVPTVVDPVMVAATGDRLLSPDAEDAYDALIREATLVTPNADEAAVLVGDPIESLADAEAAGRTLVDRGADAALIKGGHLDGAGSSMDDAGDPMVHDTLVLAIDDVTVRRFENPRIDTDATHGSGCTLSSAIAARLARGEPLASAVEAAVGEMSGAIRRGYDVGGGPGAVNPTTLDR
ncbi:bifunctional hydroxymethylpyrimidine kinase/phosphomethylpyrimidine kinase [Halorubrum vacuolatum]|uniref:Hydroxymethylpyrimidine/phosphomethylpyrimidine kinase n=1 Tax=Halorubrum vacuolatum TaxID=63740 RepID=A0A238WPH3_HALVU|nr:bifunctional hydroxymethylpyrimidine kinase/phosphomethylpyrimidine kinase [Halorubrum vacuolatum]SNR48510.1 hydroxymethylpyrimidine/phosphomethylpyrimidine kinase [Halorubrum vacuolatum]